MDAKEPIFVPSALRWRVTMVAILAVMTAFGATVSVLVQSWRSASVLSIFAALEAAIAFLLFRLIGRSDDPKQPFTNLDWLGRPKEKEPNQALEPTPMSVTPPAAQEPRQP